ncbi:MAG: hypothetical protein ACOC5T_10065 [Elusimicrobiota bacterium]
MTSQEPPKERPNLSGTSLEIIKTIFEELSEGGKIPKIKKGNREVIYEDWGSNTEKNT